MPKVVASRTGQFLNGWGEEVGLSARPQSQHVAVLNSQALQFLTCYGVAGWKKKNSYENFG